MGRNGALRHVASGWGNGHWQQTTAVMAGLVCSVLLLGLTGCGGGGGQPQLDAGAQPAAVDDAQLQQVLRAEFARLGLDPDKVPAAAPAGKASAVFDLKAMQPPGGGVYEVRLTWTEQACGDYDQSGVVSVGDLTPLAVNWGQTVEYELDRPVGDPDDAGGAAESEPPAAGSGAENWRRARIDGNPDGVLDIKDITPIAVNWNKCLDGYRVYRRLQGTEAWTLLGNLAGRPAVDPTRPVRYSYTLDAGAYGSHEFKVVPFDSIGDDEGAESNIAALSLAAGDPWLMYGHDAQHTFRSRSVGPATPTLKWKYSDGPISNGHPIYPSLAERGGSVAFILDERLYTLDPAGNTRAINASRVHEFSPAVLSGGSVVSISYGTDSPATKYLTAYAPGGEEQWTYLLPFNRFFPPVAGPDDAVYVAEKVDSASDIAHQITAVDSAGQELYSTDLPGSIITVLTAGLAGEVYYGYRTTNHNTQEPSYYLSRMNRDGAVAWEAFLFTTDADSTTGFSQPVVRPDGVVLAVVANQLIAFSAAGAKLWSVSFSLADPAGNGPVYLAADSANRAYFLFSELSYKTLRCVAADGTKLWSRPLDYSYASYSLAVDAARRQACCSFTVQDGQTELSLFDPEGQLTLSAAAPYTGSELFCGQDQYYLATAGSLVALDQTLQVDWRYGAVDNYWLPAICAPDGTSYVTRNTLELQHLDANGQLLWRKPFVDAHGDRTYIETGPAVDHAGVVYIGGMEGHGLSAFYGDGTNKWHNDAFAKSLSNSDPLLMPDGGICLIHNGTLARYGADGSLAWRSAGLGTNSEPGSCTMDTQGALFVLTGHELFPSLIAFNTKGNELWRQVLSVIGAPGGHCAIDKSGVLYCPAYTRLYAIPSDGKDGWVYYVDAENTSGPYIYIGQGAALSADGSIVFGVSDGRLVKLLPNGSEAWVYHAPAGILATPAIDGAGAIYAGCANGKLYAITADGELKWSYQAGGPITTSPSIANDGSIMFGAGDGAWYALGPGWQ